MSFYIYLYPFLYRIIHNSVYQQSKSCHSVSFLYMQQVINRILCVICLFLKFDRLCFLPHPLIFWDSQLFNTVYPCKILFSRAIMHSFIILLTWCFKEKNEILLCKRLSLCNSCLHLVFGNTIFCNTVIIMEIFFLT